nr:preprotein translocase subunit Sec61beta [Methanobrevibacter arboriphilus]
MKWQKKDQNMLPPTGAGLVRYFDEESTGPKISPEGVVIATIILGIFCFILNFSN